MRPSQRYLGEESPLPPVLAFILGLFVMRLFLTSTKDVKTIGILAFTAYMVIPLVTHRMRILHNHRLQEIFAYTSVLPGTLLMLLSPYLTTVETVYSLFLVSHIGYWFWACWLYASKATELYKKGYSEMLLGQGFVPIFTGIPVAIILIMVASISGIGWAEKGGLVLYAAAAVTIYFILRHS